MKILVKRIARRDKYTIGWLYIDGKFFCNTIEDKDRGLKQSMPLAQIKSMKVYGETAIPSGTYTVSMNKPSPKYQQKAKTDIFYKFCCDNMPRIENVPGYDGILIHPGIDESSSLGCLIVGENNIVGKVTNSRTTFKKIWQILFDAYKHGEPIKLTIE